MILNHALNSFILHAYVIPKCNIVKISCQLPKHSLCENKKFCSCKIDTFIFKTAANNSKLEKFLNES